MEGETILDDSTESARDILVIDDDLDFAESLAQLLRLEGYPVATAHSMDEALGALKQRSVAVALVDIRLGQGSGVQLIRNLRVFRPEVITIMMTAYASVDTAVQSIQEGAYDYLCKPFFTEDLLATLKRCFERSRLLKERERAEAAVRARLLKAVISLMKADGGALYLSNGGLLRLAAGSDREYPDPIVLPLDRDTILGEAFARRQPAVRAGRPEIGGLANFGSQLVFPLLDSHEKLFGALFVHHRIFREFSQEDIELGHILTSFGGEAIQSAQATEDLAASQERLSKIVENSPSAISLKDLHGRYLLTNGKFDEWFGISSGADQARSGNGESRGWDGVGPEFVADSAVIASGGAISREIEVTLCDGAQHSVLVTKFPVLDGAGSAVGVGTIGTDVTEQRRAEQRLRQAQRMEAIGQLTGGVAHDFNNLLAVILGNLRLLQEEISERPDLQELVEEALDATKAGAELTNRLLAFGRGQTLRPQPTDVRKLVIDISRMLERTLGEDITIKLELADDLWNAEIDRNQLETSILNLAINARDAMPDGGQLLLCAANTSFGEAAVQSRPEVSPGDYVVLSVTDSGEGMTPEVLRKAVQPFFTTKEPGRGSGLGLSMVYGFVTQSKGHFELVSELGRGTTVSFYLPASMPGREPLAIVESGAPTGAGRGERVLIVEDQASVRRLTRRLLTQLGYEVLEAPDGQSALRLLEERADIDVLFTDIVLPGETNGVMLGRAALAAHPDLRVIYTTGYAADSLDIEEARQDTTVILRKPVQVEELSRAVRAALDRC